MRVLRKISATQRADRFIMKTLKNALDTVLSAVCIILFVFMTIIGTYQIVVRYVFNSPSTVSEELLTFSFTWMALLSAALVFGKRDHMRMGYFADKLPPTGSIILGIISELLVLLFAALILIYGGISISKLTMTQVTASLGVSMGIIYLVVPLSGILTAFYSLINIWILCQRLSNGTVDGEEEKG